MSDNFISGNDAYVALDSVEYAFNKWTLPIEGGIRKFFAFGSKFQRTLPGGISSTIQLDGPYNQGNMPLALHALVEVHLGWEQGVELVVPARVANIEFSNAIGQGGEPGGQARVTLESNGEFQVEFT